MTYYYQQFDEGHFDYELVHLREEGPAIRGPLVDQTQPFLAFIGAAQTFGRFSDDPFPSKLSRRLDIQALNLGMGGAGPDTFNPDLLEPLNRARAVVVQVLSGRSQGNSMFDNSGSGGHYGRRISDGEEMPFNKFLADLVEREPADAVQRIVEETRQRFVEAMTSLLCRIECPKILFWLSTRSPHYEMEPGSAYGYLSDFPQLVDQAMLDQLVPHADAYVECVSREGLPQKLWAASERIDGAILKDGDLYNRYYPSPEIHEQAADALEPILVSYLEAPPAEPQPLPADAPTPFIIVAAGRTGSNMLRGVIDSHPDAFVGGEVLHHDLIARKGVPWPIDAAEQDPTLPALLKYNSARYLDKLFDIARQKGFRAIGCKIMYWHGLEDDDARASLLANERLKVIHLKRHNLLKQFLSLERANATGSWGGRGQSGPPPAIELDLAKFLEFFERTVEVQDRYDELFAEHDLLQVTYEELSSDPMAVGTRCVEFLGLDPSRPLRVTTKPTGGGTLREAIANYDDFKASMGQFAHYFDD